MRTALLALGLFIGTLAVAHAADVVVATCGTIVPAGERGILQGDLDCSAAPAAQAAVVLGNRASLALAGFTLTGAVDGTGVRCSRNCTVRGPGTITSAPAGVGELRAACVRALLDPGVTPRSQRVEVENLDLRGCGAGVVGDTGRRGLRLTAEHVVADGNYASFTAADIQARDVSASNGSGAGFYAPTGKVTGADVHADNNDPTGVVAARLSLTDSTASGNVAFGVQALAGPVKLVRATVTGSGIRDVLSARPPHVAGSACGTSARWIPPNGIGEPWGVCAGD